MSMTTIEIALSYEGDLRKDIWEFECEGLSFSLFQLTQMTRESATQPWERNIWVDGWEESPLPRPEKIPPVVVEHLLRQSSLSIGVGTGERRSEAVNLTWAYSAESTAQRQTVDAL